MSRLGAAGDLDRADDAAEPLAERDLIERLDRPGIACVLPDAGVEQHCGEQYLQDEGDRRAGAVRPQSGEVSFQSSDGPKRQKSRGRRASSGRERRDSNPRPPA